MEKGSLSYRFKNFNYFPYYLLYISRNEKFTLYRNWMIKCRKFVSEIPSNSARISITNPNLSHIYIKPTAARDSL